MSETEFAVRSVGEDAVFSASGDRAGGRSGRDRSRRSRRSRESEEPEAVVQAAPESEQKPLLLELVNRVVEFLDALWERLRSV